MNWISVKEKLPDDDFDCFVLLTNGYGYGRYDYIYDFANKNYTKTDNKRWYLDFDAVGYEDEITHWMKIVYPEK